MGANTSSQSSNSQPQYPMPIQGLMYQTGDLLSDLQNSLVGGGLGTAPGGQDVLGMNAQGQNLYQQMFSPKVQNIPGLTPGQQNVLRILGARAGQDPFSSYDVHGANLASAAGVTNPFEQAALGQIDQFTGGPIGSSPATIAAMKAARDPALNDLALAGLANSDAVGSNLTAAYAPILAQEMAIRSGVIPQLAQMGQNLRGGTEFGANFFGNLGNTLEQRTGARLGEYNAAEEAQRQIAAQIGQAEYNDFLRQINAASSLSTGLLGQAPVGALSSSTGSSLKAGLK
jgi:hypothetical protein